MTILTGLALAVVVGVIVQKSNDIMDFFADTPKAQVEDDFFLVRADRAHALDLLINDAIDHVSPIVIDIRSQPRCGSLSVAGSNVIYDGEGRCAGTITFAYCIQGVTDCQEAVVSLNVRPGRGPNAEPVANAPAVPSVPGGAAMAAVIAPELGQSIGALAHTPRMAPGQEAENIAAAQAYLHDTATLSLEGPVTKDSTYRASPTSPTPLDPSLTLLFVDREKAVKINPFHDQGIDAPLKPISLDDGSVTALLNGCQIRLDGRASVGAEIALTIFAPCFPAQVAEIVQNDFFFAMRLNRDGQGSILLPAFDVDAEIAVYFPGHDVPVIVSMRVPELARLARSAVSVEQAAALNLAAREYSAEDGSRLVQVDSSVDVAETISQQKGYVKAYIGENGRNVYVYTHPLLANGTQKTVQLTLRGASDKACGRSTQIDLMDTRAKDLPVQVTQIDLPVCKLGAVYENTLRDVVVNMK